MDKQVTIDFGLQQLIEVPKYGLGEMYNEYGFYCTKCLSLANVLKCEAKDLLG